MSVTQLCNYINGASIAPISGKYIDGVNPSTGKVISAIPDSDYRDCALAIEAAQNALPAWRKQSFAARAEVLRTIAAEMRKIAPKLIETECTDMGKPIMFMANGDMPVAIEEFELYARLILSDTTPYYQMPDAVSIEHRNAIGVCALITPWNFPLMLFCNKIAACIACGNTCVCKPSEMSPMSAALMCDVFSKAGVPKGVINVVHGYGVKAAQPFVESDVVGAVSFTGGSVTGRLVSAIAAPKLKKLQLELGGKNASIVFEDCYFDETVAGVATAGFMNTGQVCCSGSRVLIQRSIFKKFVSALKEHVSQTWSKNIGSPLAPGTQMGPLVSKQHFEKVQRYFELAKREGGEVILGGRAGGKALGLPAELSDGYFFEPTIVVGLSDDCRCAMEEIFGPIITVHPFDTQDDAIRIANQVEYGLAACVWTSDIRRGQTVARVLDSGTVWINCYLNADPRQPFGGFKNSGVNRENGLHSIRFYSELKAIVSKL
jgi:aminomuconate-semialdehyde/2-hydroxymuconate-6-semialdehyde dehydrogenase